MLKISSASRTNHQFDAYTGISGSESNIPAEEKDVVFDWCRSPSNKSLKGAPRLMSPMFH